MSDAQAKSKKRRELFEKQSKQMLQGYNQNSFKTGNRKKSRHEGYKDPKSHHSRRHGEDRQPNNHNENGHQIESGHPKQSSNKEEFKEILDKMSLNSSSKLIEAQLQMQRASNGRSGHLDKELGLNKTENSQNLNLNKSKSGLIANLMHGKEFGNIKLHDASQTLNSKMTSGGPNALNMLDPAQINLDFDNQSKEENQRQFELNQQQFAEENPYAQTQEISLPDFQKPRSKDGTRKSKSRPRSQERAHHRHKNKISAFEKYEEIRFACYEFQQKLKQMQAVMGTLTQKIANDSSVNMQNQTLEVPLHFIEQMHQLSNEVVGDFEQVQGQWNECFDDQQSSNQRQRSKTRLIKRRLKDMENQSILYHKDQKEFEKSLHTITQAYDKNTIEMDQQLNQIESQVSKLKNTRDDLNCRYERQLDHAVKEMINFYENIENAAPDEIDSDNMSIEQVFFIKPTHEIQQTINQKKEKSESQLQIRAAPSEEPKAHPRPLSQNNHKTPSIPKLKMERLQDHTPEPPKIIQINPKSGRSNGQMPQSTKNGRQADKNNCPSGRKKQTSAKKNSGRESNQKLTHRSNKAISKRTSKQGEEEMAYVVNPVMVGAMQQTSKFDNQFEDDFEGANTTLDMNTERLKQFPEDYEAINSIECPDQRILLKQVLFMKYEKILKKQAKQERKRKKKLQKMQREAIEQQKRQESAKKESTKKTGELQFPQPKCLIPTPTHKSSFAHFGKFQNPQSSKGSLRGGHHLSSSSSVGMKHNQNAMQGLGINERPTENHDQTYPSSRFSLQSALPSLDTVDVISAQKKFQAMEVNQSDLFNAEQFLAIGLKTATQTSLIKQYEEDFKQKEQIREQIKNDEKKLNLSSSNQSRISINQKQISQNSRLPPGDILSRQYFSGNTNNPILIADSHDCSMVSDFKDPNRASDKNLPGLNPQLDLSSLNQQQVSVKSKRSSNQKPSMVFENKSLNNDQSLVFSQEQSFIEKHNDYMQPEKKVRQNYESNHRMEDNGEKINESMASGGSNCQRFLDLNEYQESPSINIKNSYNQNSYVNSDHSNSQMQNDQNADIFEIENQLDIEEFKGQNQVYLDNHFNSNIRKKLELDVIHERQSEFSQSMMTNAQRINTNRSKQSHSKNNGNGHYANMGKGESFPSNSGMKLGNSALPSVRSEFVNQSSANRKNSSRGITQESINNDTGKVRRENEEQNRFSIVRSNSVVHTQRNDNSFVQLSHRNYQNASIINDQQVCIDGSVNLSRNNIKRISSSSKDMNENSYLKMIQRQPSAGNFESQGRYFEQELNNLQSQNYKQQAQAFKNHINADMKALNINSSQNHIPPSGKMKGGERKDQITRNNDMQRLNKNGNNYTNLSQHMLLSDKEYLQNQRGQYFQQPHSHRSHNIHGGDSLRDRSYFDESPAIMDQNYENEMDQVSRNEYIKRARGSLSSQQVEKSVTQSQLQSAQAYRADEDGNSNSQQKFDSSIRTTLLQMQSIPQSSIHSTSRESRSKNFQNQRSKESKLIGDTASIPLDTLQKSSLGQTVSDLILAETNKDLNEIDNLDKQGQQKSFGMMIRSSSECQLRDKEFYEMCDEEDEIAMYCKFAEQSILEAMHNRRLSQSNNKPSVMPNIHNQSSESPAQLLTSHMQLLNGNKSSSITNNHLVFMSQQTFKKIYSKYMQTQDKTQIGHQICPIGNSTVNDQNSSQQQTRGKGTFKKFLNDPSRLLASINGIGPVIPQNFMNNYLGTNLLTTSLEDQTLNMHNNIMMPTHQYNRRTLLMMQNLHNNYLYSANSGILFTMQRGWNSGYSGDTAGITNNGIGQSFNNLTNIGKIDKELINNNASGIMNGLNAAALNNSELNCEPKVSQLTNGDNKLKSLGGEPVNISNLLLGAKQQTTDPINVGSITIVDDDGKFMIDRKLLLEANNSASQQTKGRRLFSQSRNINGQVTSTTDFSNLQTKQLGILKNNYNQVYNKQNYRKTSDSINTSQITCGGDKVHDHSNEQRSPYHKDGCYGTQRGSSGKPSNKHTQKRSDSRTSSQPDDNDHKKTASAGPKIHSQYQSVDNKNKIMNLLVGLKQIQKKNGGNPGSQRSGSDLSQPRNPELASKSIRTQSQLDTHEREKSNKSSIQQIIRLQHQKNQMNLSSSIGRENNDSALSNNLKSKSVPKRIVGKQNAVGSANVIRKDKVKLLLSDLHKMQSSQKVMMQNETVKNFNTIIGTSSKNLNPAILQAHVQSLATSTDKKAPIKSNRTSSSICQIQQKSGANFIMKKNSNGAISSARSSSKNDYIQQTNTKLSIKKKVPGQPTTLNLKQFASQLAK